MLREPGQPDGGGLAMQIPIWTGTLGTPGTQVASRGKSAKKTPTLGGFKTWPGTWQNGVLTITFLPLINVMLFKRLFELLGAEASFAVEHGTWNPIRPVVHPDTRHRLHQEKMDLGSVLPGTLKTTDPCPGLEAQCAVRTAPDRVRWTMARPPLSASIS